ncbi:MAG: type IX secretion system outer membrane channel protein PorV [Paludibacteraceae bacterium]|nr:type IX secretion system outer membrane channel protein PorV [Paludibacteraceae bacterium]
MKKQIFSLLALALISVPALAVEVDASMNPVITGMPSQSIGTDAVAGALGDVGAATTPDMYSQHWNPSKYAFMKSHGGIAVNYTPWLRKLVGDIDLAYISGYYKFSDLDAISASFRYFSMGNVTLTDNQGQALQDAKPNEWALDVAYSRVLSEHFSMGVTLRAMVSDLNNGTNLGGGVEMHPAWTMAADVSMYYQLPIEISMGESKFAWGLNISNLGGKVTYDDDNRNFIPANLKFGLSYELPFDDYNRLTFSGDLNKLLVPTMQSKIAQNELGDDYGNAERLRRWYSDMSSAKGWFVSFADAPGGFKEELQEVQFGLGVEYSYNRQFFARFGYSHENKLKGNRRYFTVGAGFKLSIFELHAAYVIGTAATNPLDQTLRFSMAFDLAGIKDLIKD